MASFGFRWLDILEKEFDKAFVDLDLAIGELDSEEPDVVFNVRQRLCCLSSCFAQLTHKAQTVFQNSAKIEAELIHMRTELIESKAKREVLEQELHNLLLQLHSSQLSDSLNNRKQDAHFKPDVNNIKKRLDDELRQSPIRNAKGSKDSSDTELKLNSAFLDTVQSRTEKMQLQLENAALRSTILNLNSEVYGAKLAAKYLDKELAGRIQQLQLLGREMRGDVRDKLWRQLESEILLQRHKTVVRACRKNSLLANNTDKPCPKPVVDDNNEQTQHFGDIRTVVVKRNVNQGLGISITGGREHGVPILISELEPNGPAALTEQLYIGDAILFVNEHDLRQCCHKEAADILQQQSGDCTLQVQYVAADDSDTSLEEDGYNFRFFGDEVCDSKQHSALNTPLDMLNTPTAPRTPESTSTGSRLLSSPRTNNSEKLIEKSETLINYNLNNAKLNKTTFDDKDSKIVDVLNCNNNATSLFTNETETDGLILLDNATNNMIKLKNYKKIDLITSNDDENFNCSTNSLNSDNFSSPMQTSADVFLDSELLSTTDVASNDSHSPKNVQLTSNDSKKSFLYDDEDVKEIVGESKPLYTSNESLSNPKSDQSLLTGDSCGSSPVCKNKKVQRKHRKKYFGVKTLQSIFNNKQYAGYSDISSTASEIGDDFQQNRKEEKMSVEEEMKKEDATVYKCNTIYSDTSQQFEENIHNILSDIFVKNFMTSLSDAKEAGGASGTAANNVAASAIHAINRPTGTKKYFSLHGQNLRVGKALRLCPNDDYTEHFENEQRKEKLLARYVYSANSVNVDGVGDPDFGTPV